MISLRGMLAIAIGAIFLWFSAYPEDFVPSSPPPAFIKLLTFLAGGFLTAMGLVSMAFVFHRYYVIRSVAPEPADVTVVVDESSDSTTYTLSVRCHDELWAIGATGGKALNGLDEGTVYPGQVWRRNGAPVAIAINGVQVNTLPFPRRQSETN